MTDNKNVGFFFSLFEDSKNYYIPANLLNNVHLGLTTGKDPLMKICQIIESSVRESSTQITREDNQKQSINLKPLP